MKTIQQNTTQRLVKVALVAALYAAVTLAFAPISYGNIQFRVSEVLVLLAFFDPFYIGGLTLGCFIANLLGPNGAMDIIFGTFATLISVVAVHATKRLFKNHTLGLFIASLWPTLFNGLIIGWMLHMVLQYPLALTMLQVGIGQFVVITVVGVPLFLLIGHRYQHLLHVHK